MYHSFSFSYYSYAIYSSLNQNIFKIYFLKMDKFIYMIWNKNRLSHFLYSTLYITNCNITCV